jgi:hypothetical protein
MRLHHDAMAGEPRLRIVFADTSFLVDLRDHPTLGDVAGRIDDIARQHESAPVSIDVRFSAHRQPPRANASVSKS